MSRTRIILIALLIVFGIVGYSSVYTVHERDQVLVLQFGKVVREDKSPGLHFKIPFIQNVRYFDRRVLDLDVPPAELPTSDQKQVVVDTIARYRIKQPLQFFQAARTLEGFEQQLGTIISSTTRAVLARVSLAELLTAKRANIMQDIASQVGQAVETRYGVDLIDVRLKRLDLPPQNSDRILERMRSQRVQEATGIRANGERQFARIVADADRDARVIVAEAERQSQELRGEGEGKAQEIYNKAYGRDASFFEFWISMNALRESLASNNTRYIGPASGEFFKYFGNMNGQRDATATAKK